MSTYALVTKAAPGPVTDAVRAGHTGGFVVGDPQGTIVLFDPPHRTYSSTARLAKPARALVRRTTVPAWLLPRPLPTTPATTPRTGAVLVGADTATAAADAALALAGPHPALGCWWSAAAQRRGRGGDGPGHGGARSPGRHPNFMEIGVQPRGLLCWFRAPRWPAGPGCRSGGR